MKDIPGISFETLVEIIDQLPIEQQQMLLHHIQGRSHPNGQSAEEKMRILRAAQIDVPVNQAPSPRREDWYDDDGR